jgi:hypothetical protein
MAYFKLTSVTKHGLGKHIFQATEFWHEKHIKSKERPNVDLNKPLESGLYCFKIHPVPARGSEWGIIKASNIRSLVLC